MDAFKNKILLFNHFLITFKRRFSAEENGKMSERLIFVTIKIINNHKKIKSYVKMHDHANINC